jgi:tRNA(adenine34) deaminase
MDYDHFMGAALKEARKALARGEFPVGCVVVHGDRIVARGSRKGTRGDARNEVDHAEMVALRRLAAHTDPVDPSAVTVFSTMEPCLMCFSALMLHGIGEIVYGFEDAMGGGTVCDRSRLRPLYRDNRIRVCGGIRRAESLALFKAFFADPRTPYWRGSYLAQYTLKQ